MKLLLIEDDPQLSRVLEISLEREGYEVDLFTDGAKGFQQALTHTYDGIVLDWTLPRMTGIEICKSLRENNIKTPIIMLTGRSTSRDKVSGLDTGADDYLTKPFSSDELYARLRSILRRKPATTDILRVGNLELDPKSHQVKLNEKIIHLMPKEYELLEYLMQHKDEATHRADILKDVWNIEVNNSSNRLEVYVKHLRQKIDKDPETNLIQTVRGIGYRLSTPKK